MTSLNPSMRLKIKRDTFYLPDSNNGVYFRNNLSSFRMEGSSINQWVEKLIPMFNGEYTLENLTDGLPGPYRERVYEIAEVLYRNGFVSDVSKDHPHQLEDHLIKKYGPQIEFVNSFVDSGAYRFQTYRQAKVLAVGSGPFFSSLVASLLESGLPKFKLLITDKKPTNRRQIMELAAHARKTDYEVEVEEMALEENGVRFWREIIQSFDAVLYVSEEGDLEELRLLHSVCLEEKKIFLPSICLQKVGIAGPLVHQDSDVCWESAWRRLHHSVLMKDRQLAGFSSKAGAMLANVIVFELFKEITGVTKSKQNNNFFLLDLDTMEGKWHSFFPHLLVTGRKSAKWVEDTEILAEHGLRKGEPSELLLYFHQLTSKESGIFHIWEEGDLKQLPLAQCRVQAVNPLSEGPAGLLQEIVCTGLTHEEARTEAGFAGIESYAAQMVDLIVPTLSSHTAGNSLIESQEFFGIGAGETVAESVSRGLQKCLEEELRKQHLDKKNFVAQVQIRKMEDERCKFYLQSLTTLQGTPMIGLGKEILGFPVVWVGTNDGWYRSVDLNITLALRKALQNAVFGVQNQSSFSPALPLKHSSVHLEDKEPQNIDIPAKNERVEAQTLKSALEVLERNHKRLLVFELELEPFIKEKLAGVFGVLLKGEESR
ncbi:putative thiazole-containing bacteriocin maturation protein [Paenibacillus sp. BSR1-1]|uniref:putative thiazole-containing bacteriocin maturation protein n=1 Tax=Paenibacillus sp. BSR1-1 TaxID=3020845 RepID=UPI0025B1F1AF|nr:putative thiazole-containing bacteriocin maturation protein [Paenibacillus sp. BSR1-1]MDN3017135.1 putative thiazole-containing bacteriocin maturation protein [Paenibacillus sp. BSR1-1]